MLANGLTGERNSELWDRLQTRAERVHQSLKSRAEFFRTMPAPLYSYQVEDYVTDEWSDKEAAYLSRLEHLRDCAARIFDQCQRVGGKGLPFVGQLAQDLLAVQKGDRALYRAQLKGDNPVGIFSLIDLGDLSIWMVSGELHRLTTVISDFYHPHVDRVRATLEDRDGKPARAWTGNMKELTWDKEQSRWSKP